MILPEVLSDIMRAQMTEQGEKLLPTPYMPQQAERPKGTDATIKDRIQNSSQMTEYLTYFGWVLSAEEAYEIFKNGHLIAKDQESLDKMVEKIKTKADEAIFDCLSGAERSLTEKQEERVDNLRGDPIFNGNFFRRALQIAGWYGIEQRESEILDKLEAFLVAYGEKMDESKIFDIKNAGVFHINSPDKYMNIMKMLLESCVDCKYLTPRCSEYSIRYLKYQLKLDLSSEKRKRIEKLAEDLRQLGIKIDEDEELMEMLTSSVKSDSQAS